MRSRLKSKFLDMSHYVSLMIFTGLIFQPFWDAEQNSQNVPGIHILFKTQRRRRSMQGCQTWGHQNQTRDSRDSWNIAVLPLSRTLVNQIAASSLRPIKQPFTDSSCPSSLLQSFSSKMFQVCRNIAIIAVVHNQQTSWSAAFILNWRPCLLGRFIEKTQDGRETLIAGMFRKGCGP